VKLFLDMDGVLADFDGHYEQHFGVRLPRSISDPPGMWENIRAHGSFYLDMPLMPDALTLWNGVAHLAPTLLTGVPHSQVPAAESHRRGWARQHLGADVEVICCKSRDKRLHGQPGDVLVDDWTLYRHLWLKMGGVFVLHTSAADSLEQLKGLI
jgi:hypothetical protein